MKFLILDSEQLMFVAARSGVTHVRDTEVTTLAGRAGITLCGRSLGKMTATGERQHSDVALCSRCMDSLWSEKRWSGFGIKPERYQHRWHISASASDADAGERA